MFICLNAKMLKCNKSFTLIEILVSITIFTFLIMAALGVYITSITKHRQALKSQVVNEELQYVVEITSRDINISDGYLMASRDSDVDTRIDTIYLNHPTKKIVGAECTGLGGVDCDKCCNQPAQCDVDLFSCECCLQYRFNSTDNTIEVKGKGDSDFVALTSSRIEIENVYFNIDSVIAGNLARQPKITILIKAKEKNDILGTSEIILQTTITQREIFNLYQGAIP